MSKLKTTSLIIVILLFSALTIILVEKVRVRNQKITSLEIEIKDIRKITNTILSGSNISNERIDRLKDELQVEFLSKNMIILYSKKSEDYFGNMVSIDANGNFISLEEFKP